MEKSSPLGREGAYAYDADQRLVGRTYSDGTPGADFYYDQASPWGIAVSNPVGRLTEEQTATGGTVLTGEIFGYDPMGRVATDYQCTPYNCGSGAWSLAYAWNALGEPLSWSNGAGQTFAAVYDAAARLGSLTSSLSDAQHPGTLISNMVYNDPFGLESGAGLGNGQSETFGYDLRGRVTAIAETGLSTPGAGAIAITGSEQSLAGAPAEAGKGWVAIGGPNGGNDQQINYGATPGTGSAAVSGGEQAYPVAAVAAAGWVEVNGQDAMVTQCVQTESGQQCYQFPDQGTLTVCVNGACDAYDYSPASAADEASGVASVINGDSGSPVTASASGQVVYLTAKAGGAGSDYSLSTSVASNYGVSPGFYFAQSGNALAGGANAYTIYDAGTVSLTVNGQTATVGYGQGSTAVSVAQALAAALGALPVTANIPQSAPSTLNLTATTGGAGTNYSASGASATSEGHYFSSPSFSLAAGNLSGGANAYTVYDSGTVSLTVNGQTATVGYGQGSTADSVAQALAGALGSLPVTASPSGATINLTAGGKGAGTNYSLSASSATNNGRFSGPSFTTATSGSALTGGVDQGATIYDGGTVTANVGGFVATASYGQGDTPNSVASGLAAALNGSGSPVTASASGATVTVVTTASGSAADDLAVSVSSATSDGGQFGSASFAASGPGRLGGAGWGGYNVSLGYAPDGDVAGASDWVNGDWTYQYDDLNRLAGANCAANCPGGQSQLDLVWGYDRFGNRWTQSTTAGAAPAPSATFWGTNGVGNNRMDGASYDASGDTLGDGDGNTYVYDAEGRISAVSGGAGSIEYVYDAQGRRVEKVVNGVATSFVHDLGGRAVSEFAGNGGPLRNEVYLGGRHLATYYGGTTYFDYADWLGTERARAAYNGGPYESCSSLPYGDMLGCGYAASGPGDATELHFTGKMRDAATGLDYFGARYYSAASGGDWGRFMTPDFGPTKTPVPFANYENPQTLNLYAIAGDDPVSLVDTNGHSFLVFNAHAHTITLYSHDGTFIGRWAAYNNVDQKHTKGALKGGMANGTYAFSDTNAPHPHSDDGPNSRFGSYGIFRLERFRDANGTWHEGVGVHSGREGVADKKGRKGPEHATDGCIRSTDAMMKKTGEVAKDDPLTALTVEGAAASLPPQYLQPPPPSPVGPGTGLFSMPAEMVNAFSEACQQGNPAACL